ncbi:MAG: AI-2E family transporter, partial [Elusimicrobia bacterium]|nr:AI-2E family transporter [Elusimicrobiota bacterium]
SPADVARRPPVPPWWTLLVAAGGLYFLYHIHEVVVPFVLSFALAFLLSPVVNFFTVRGLRREQVVAGIYLVVATVITLTANWVLPAMTSQLALLEGRAPGYVNRVRDLIGSIQYAVAARMPFGSRLVESWNLKLYDPLMRQLPHLPSYLLGLVPLFSLLFLVPFITFFVLLDSPKFQQNAIQILPSRYVEQALHLLSEVESSLGNYIRGVLIISGAVGSAAFVGLWALGVNYPVAIGALSGFASFIPYLGAILGLIVGALVAFFQFQNFSMPLKVVALFLGIRFADEIFVEPFVAKHSINLHPLVFLFALMIGGEVFGFVGLLFAVPAACVLKALATVAWDWYVSEAQMAAPPAVPGAEVPYV